MPVIFGRTAVAAVTDNYAYLATTDSITITRYDEAGTAVEVSFEQPRERVEAGWERFVRDTTRANIESIEPGQIFLGGRNFMMSIREFRLGLIDDLPARPTMPASLRIVDILDISADRVLVGAKGAHDESLIEVYAIER